jgi:hypothetical protein
MWTQWVNYQDIILSDKDKFGRLLSEIKTFTKDEWENN